MKSRARLAAVVLPHVVLKDWAQFVVGSGTLQHLLHLSLAVKKQNGHMRHAIIRRKVRALLQKRKPRTGFWPLRGHKNAMSVVSDDFDLGGLGIPQEGRKPIVSEHMVCHGLDDIGRSRCHVGADLGAI